MIRHAGLPIAPLTMDHPGEDVSGKSCCEEREKRIACHTAGYGVPTLADVPLSLWILLAGLAHIVAALVVDVSDCLRSTVCDIKQSLSHLIQKLLGRVLLPLIRRVVRR